MIEETEIQDPVQDKLNETYTSFFDNVLKPIRVIYMDMELIQDLKLGSLLTFVTMKEEIEYIQHRIPIYNARLDDDCGKYFPLLKISEKEIIERMRDPKYMDVVCTVAPFGSTYQELVRLLNGIAQHNDMTTSYLPVKILINVADLTYPKLLQLQFIESLKTSLKNIEVIFTANKRYDDDLYTSCDILLLYDLATFVKPGTNTSNLMFKSGKFIDSKIFSPKRIGPGLEIPEDKKEIAFKTTQTWLEMFCDVFVYMSNFLPIKEKESNGDSSS